MTSPNFLYQVKSQWYALGKASLSGKITDNSEGGESGPIAPPMGGAKTDSGAGGLPPNER